MAELATVGLRVDAAGGISELRAWESASERAAAQTTALERTVGSLKATILKYAGVVGAAWLGNEFLRNTVDAQNAMAQLEAAVASTGGAAGRSVAQLDAQSMALLELTRFSDEAVKGSQSLLLTFDKIKGVQFDEATLQIANLAERMGGDLKGASLQVGKALQDPVQGLLALRRSGVSFSEAQQQVIKDLFNTGHEAEAQTLILKELEHEFGGAAVAARGTLGGALTHLKNVFGDLFEVSKGGSSSVVSFIDSLARALQSIPAHVRELRELAKVLGAVAVAYGLVTLANGGLVTGLIALRSALGVNAAVGILSTLWFSVTAAFGAAGVAGTGLAGVIAGLNFTLTGTLAVLGPLALAVAGAIALWLAYKKAVDDARAADVEAIESERDKTRVQVARDEAKIRHDKDIARAKEQAALAAEEAAQRAAEATKKQVEEALKVIATVKAENGEQRAMIDTIRLGQKAVDALTIAQAGNHAVREKGLGLSPAIQAALRAEAEATARLTIEQRKQADAMALGAQIRKDTAARIAAEGATAQAAEWKAASDADMTGTLVAVREAVEKIKKMLKAAGLEVADDAAKRAQVLAKEIQRHFSDAFNNIFTQGVQSFRDLFSAIRDMLLRLAADFAAMKLMEKLMEWRGKVGAWQQQAIGAGLAGAGVGYGIGSATGSTSGGIIGGAAAGAMAGNAMLPGGWGAAIGGLAGAAGGLLGAASAQKAAAEQLQKAAIAFANTADSYITASFGDDQASRLLAEQQRYTALYNEATRLYMAGALSAGEYKKRTDDLNDATQRYTDAIYKDTAAIVDHAKALQDAARAMEDLDVRHLNATGQSGRGSTVAFQNAQRREYEDARTAGRSPEYLALLTSVQVEEAIQRAQTIEIERQTGIIQQAAADAAARYDVEIKLTQDALRVAEDQLRAQERAVQETQRVVDSLRDFAAGLSLNPSLTTLSPAQQLEEARRQYEATLGLANGGDKTAAGNLPGAASAFLSASRGYNASGTAYVADFMRVQESIKAVQDKFGTQLTVEQQILTQLQAHTSALQAQLAATQAAKDQAAANAQAQIQALDGSTSAQVHLLTRVLEFLSDPDQGHGVGTTGPALTLGDSFTAPLAQTTTSVVGAITSMDTRITDRLDRANLLEESEIRLLSDALSQVIQRVAAVEDRVSENTGVTRRGFEGAAL